MKFAHIVAAIAFGISLAVSHGDIARGVETGANWGFWISVILGSIGIIILLALSLFLIIAGGIAAKDAVGPVGGIAASFGIGVFMTIVTVLGIASVVLAAVGYDGMRTWGTSGLADKAALVRGAVCLGISILFSLFQGSGSFSSPRSSQ